VDRCGGVGWPDCRSSQKRLMKSKTYARYASAKMMGGTCNDSGCRMSRGSRQWIETPFALVGWVRLARIRLAWSGRAPTARALQRANPDRIRHAAGHASPLVRCELPDANRAPLLRTGKQTSFRATIAIPAEVPMIQHYWGTPDEPATIHASWSIFCAILHVLVPWPGAHASPRLRC